MSYAYNASSGHYVGSGPEVDHLQWNNNQLYSSNAFGDHQQFNSTEISLPQQLTSRNLTLNEKDDCDFIEGHILNDFNVVGKQELNNNYNIGPPHINNTNSSTNSNESNNSSPSAFLNNVSVTNNNTDILNDIKISADGSDHGLDEKELANKRKAQNRAAQRAFRERKEMKLKELEDKLNKSENDKAELLRQLDELRKQNIFISTENKILVKNNGNPKQSSPSNKSSNLVPQNESTSSFSFPKNDEKYYYMNYAATNNQLTNPNIPYKFKRLTIPEVWDYLSSLEDEDLEIDAVMREIKGLEVCHQSGPAYPLQAIDVIVKKFRQI